MKIGITILSVFLQLLDSYYRINTAVTDIEFITKFCKTHINASGYPEFKFSEDGISHIRKFNCPEELKLFKK